MKPTVGRIVHYTNLGDKQGKFPPETQAAIVTRVHEPRTESYFVAQDETRERTVERDPVSLCIIYTTGMFFMDRVERAPNTVKAGTEAARGFWQWPEGAAFSFPPEGLPEQG